MKRDRKRYGWSKNAISRYHSYNVGGPKSPPAAGKEAGLPVSMCGLWLHHTVSSETAIPPRLSRCIGACQFPFRSGI
jgi:hypothetical protein